jgi:hypothetical protein
MVIRPRFAHCDSPPAAERERRHAGLAAEARNLMADPAYVDEMREVASIMEELRGSWVTSTSFVESGLTI